MEAVSLPWLYRLAVGFLNTLRIEIKNNRLSVNVKADVMMDVVESRCLAGNMNAECGSIFVSSDDFSLGQRSPGSQREVCSCHKYLYITTNLHSW